MKHKHNSRFHLRDGNVQDFINAPCRTANGIIYGSVERQVTHNLVSFGDAWEEALANRGAVHNFHVPTAQEKVNAHVEAVREVQKLRHEKALCLKGVL